MKSLFFIIFEDGTSFQGGTDLFDTKWKEIPNKKIKNLYYALPAGDYIRMGGYDKYFHRVEATMDLTGNSKGKTKIKSIYIYGKKEDKVVIYQIGLEKDVNLGLITKQIVNVNNLEITKLNSKNWK